MRIYGQANKCNCLCFAPIFKDRDAWFSFICIHIYYFSFIIMIQLVRFPIHF